MITFTQQQVEKKIEKFCEEQFSKEAQKMEKPEDILDYCIRKAWADATQRERFKGQDSKIIPNKKDIQEILTSQIKSIFETETKKIKSSSDYNKWHNEICSIEDYGMKYGIWQKFINMTFKYMYCFKRIKSKFDFQYCHCPIDRIIAQRADTLCVVCGLKQSRIMKSIAESGKVNWNEMKAEHYQEVRNKIQEITENCTINNSDTRHPTELEFDFLLW